MISQALPTHIILDPRETLVQAGGLEFTTDDGRIMVIEPVVWGMLVARLRRIEQTCNVNIGPALFRPLTVDDDPLQPLAWQEECWSHFTWGDERVLVTAIPGSYEDVPSWPGDG